MYFCQMLFLLYMEIAGKDLSSALHGEHTLHGFAFTQPHSLDLLKKLMECRRVITIRHPLYLPELTPADFFLFPDLNGR